MVSRSNNVFTEDEKKKKKSTVIKHTNIKLHTADNTLKVRLLWRESLTEEGMAVHEGKC